MIRRVLSLTFGIGVGIAVGAVVVRRLDRAARSVAPRSLAGRTGAVAATAGDRLRAAWEETRIAAREQEAVLRRRFEVPTSRDLSGRG